MVTGVETAGLVLAIFPLVVKGLNYYVQGIEVIRHWTRVRRELGMYAHVMEAQFVFYQNTIEELLADIVQTDDEFNILLQDPGGIAWRQPDIAERLRARLDRSYDSYFRTMAFMMEALNSLGKDLGFDNRGTIVKSDGSFVKRELKSVKIALKQNIYNEAIAKITKANTELRSCTQQNLALEPIRCKRRSVRTTVDFKTIRRQATSLYHAVMNGRSWKCQCRNYHLATLCLETRPLAIKSFKSGVRFRMLFSKVTDEIDKGSRQYSCCREIDVEPVELNADVSMMAMSETHPGAAIALSSNEPSATVASARKEVRFAPTLEAPNSVDSDITIIGTPSNLSIAPIPDICSAVYESDIAARGIGFLVDEGAVRHRHYLQLVGAAVHLEMKHSSLEGLLHRNSRTPSGCSLTRKDRLCIAAILAWTVMQYDRTPWLKPQWTSSDILFPVDENTPSDASRRVALTPHLSWKMLPAETHEQISKDVHTLEKHLIHSEALLNLGLTLVELCFGKTLSELADAADMDTNKTITRLNTARRLLDDVDMEGGTEYGDVVRRCLFCPFEVRNFSLDNEVFQQAVFDKVVTPLVDSITVFNGNDTVV